MKLVASWYEECHRMNATTCSLDALHAGLVLSPALGLHPLDPRLGRLLVPSAERPGSGIEGCVGCDGDIGDVEGMRKPAQPGVQLEA